MATVETPTTIGYIMHTLAIDEKPPVRAKRDNDQSLKDTSEAAAYDAWFRAQVAQGLAEADDPAAVWVTHEEVKASWGRKRAELAKLAGGGA